MGSSVKQIAILAVGVAVTIATAGAATPLVGATMAGVLGAVAGAATSYVAGKALGVGKTKLDDSQPISSYATTSLQNATDNNNSVQVVYGKCRIGGNRVYADIQTGSNSNLYEIIVFAGHEINGYIELLADNKLMTQGVGVDVDKWRHNNDKILVKTYTKKPATPIKAISSYSGGVYTEVDLSSLTMQNNNFLDVNLPSDCAFIVVHHIYDATLNNSRQTINGIIEGKLIRTITNSTTINNTLSYSNNPSEIVLDLLTANNTFNEDDTKIDISSFYNSKTLNNTNSFTCNIAFTSSSALSACMEEILATFRGQLIYSQGLWKLKQDSRTRPITFQITENDIIVNTFAWTQKKAIEIANKIVVSYIEPTDQWQSRKTTIENTSLITSDGREYVKELTLRGVTNLTQANKIKELTLNQFRYTQDELGNRINVTPLTVGFTTTIKNAGLEVGDYGSLDYYELPTIKNFVILSIITKQSGELEVVMQEVADTHYKNTSNSYIIN